MVERNEKELFHSINSHVIYFPTICTLNLLLPDFSIFRWDLLSVYGERGITHSWALHGNSFQFVQALYHVLKSFDYLSSDTFIVLIKALANEGAMECHTALNNALCWRQMGEEARFVLVRVIMLLFHTWAGSTNYHQNLFRTGILAQI